MTTDQAYPITLDEKALDVALSKHICTEHPPCRVGASHLIRAYEQARLAALPEGVSEDDDKMLHVMRCGIWQNRNRDALNQQKPITQMHGATAKRAFQDAKAAVRALRAAGYRIVKATKAPEEKAE